MYAPLPSYEITKIFTLFYVFTTAKPVPEHGGVAQLVKRGLQIALGPAIRPSQRVTNPVAFLSGAASTRPNNDNDGAGNGHDRYVYYSGPASSFPSKDTWVSFGDMFSNSSPQLLISCGNENPPQQNDRFILAVIMQESTGCIRVPRTTDSDNLANPGLMQSANGSSYDPTNAIASIFQMVRDGTQGTAYGNGLVQAINQYGNVYDAARIYNSGSIPEGGNLSGEGATSCYVSDIANRLTGWVNAPHGCPP